MGTSHARGGYLISVKNINLMQPLSYYKSVQFSPNSKWIAYSSLSGIKSKEKEGIEDRETLDLFIMDTETFAIKMIGKANRYTDYYSSRWDHNILKYIKHDLQINTNEEKTFNVEADTSLRLAIMDKNETLAISLLNNGADPNLNYGTLPEGGSGLVPLISTLNMKQYKVAEALIQHGAWLDHEFQYNYSVFTPLSNQLHSCNYEGTKFLLDHGAKIISNYELDTNKPIKLTAASEIIERNRCSNGNELMALFQK